MKFLKYKDMATTIQESFRQFSSNLNITDKQTEIVSNCRKNVNRVIGVSGDIFNFRLIIYIVKSVPVEDHP